jgi:hypothetical protein
MRTCTWKITLETDPVRILTDVGEGHWVEGEAHLRIADLTAEAAIQGSNQKKRKNLGGRTVDLSLTYVRNLADYIASVGDLLTLVKDWPGQGQEADCLLEHKNAESGAAGAAPMRLKRAVATLEDAWEDGQLLYMRMRITGNLLEVVV